MKNRSKIAFIFFVGFAILANLLATSFAYADYLSELRELRQQQANQLYAQELRSQASAESAVTPWSGSTSDLESIAASLFDDASVSIRNLSFSGSPEALGSYEELPTGEASTRRGVILSTGLAIHADTVSFPSVNLGQPGDPRLSELSGGPTFDAAIIEFEFQVAEPGIRFEFQFASEEYPEFVREGFNDVFALDINGSNCALTPTGQLISVDQSVFSSAPEGLSYNGITGVNTCARLVQPAPAWNTARFAIADTGDEIFDSAVFVAGFRRNIPPLMFIHGWTSEAAAWDPAKTLLREVAALDADQDDRIEIISSRKENTIDAWASIADNAQVIIDQADELFSRHGQRVNVIAHSKGGLDTRLASALRPDLFDTVVMLGTPNAGSLAADNLCELPLSLVNEKKRFGSCSRPANAGLNDLRIYSMLSFNRTWASPPSISYFTLGGDKGTTTGKQRCWAENNNVRILGNASKLWWAYGTASPNGWDSPVCLNSLFALSLQEYVLQSDEDSQGPVNFYAHIPLGYYDDYDHTDVQVRACALLPAFGLVLPPGTVNESTQIGELDRFCATFRQPYATQAVALETFANNFGVSTLAEQTQASEETEVHSKKLLSPLVASTPLTLPSGGDRPVAVIVGHDADEVRLLTSDGVPLEVDISDLGPYEVATFATDLAAGSTVILQAQGGTEAIVTFLVARVANPPELAVQVTETGARAIITDPAGGPVSGLVYAISGDETLIVDGEPFADIGSATVDFALPAGQRVEVYAAVEQPYTRELSTSVVSMDANAFAGDVTLQEAVGQRLVVTLPVQTSVAGTYGGSLSLTDADGALIATGAALGDLANVAGELTFTFDLPAAQAAVAEGRGPLWFRDLILTRIDTGYALVAQLDGPFGILDGSLVGVPTTPLLGSVEVQVYDAEIIFVIPVLAVETYERPLLVQGRVLGPDGSLIRQFSHEVSHSAVSVTLGVGDLISGGDGTYLLTQLRLVDGVTGGTLHSVAAVPALFKNARDEELPALEDDGAPGNGGRSGGGGSMSIWFLGLFAMLLLAYRGRRTGDKQFF